MYLSAMIYFFYIITELEDELLHRRIKSVALIYNLLHVFFLLCRYFPVIMPVLKENLLHVFIK